MNDLESSLDDLINTINNEDYIIRLKVLERIIDNDYELSYKFNRLKEVQKEIVNARYYKKDGIKSLENELNTLKEEIKDLPLVSEYQDLLDMAYDTLLGIKDILESELNKSI